MQIEHAAVPTVVSLLIERKGTVLLGRRSRKKDHAPGAWESISGRVEPGETPMEAARREVLEETGLVVDVLRQIDTFTFERGANREPTTGATFHCLVSEGRERLSDEHDEFTWVTLEQARTFDLPEGLVNCIAKVLKGAPHDV